MKVRVVTGIGSLPILRLLSFLHPENFGKRQKITMGNDVMVDIGWLIIHHSANFNMWTTCAFTY
jgi:hypothetical protein